MDKIKLFVVKAEFTVFGNVGIKNKEGAIKFIKDNFIAPDPLTYSDKLRDFTIDCEEKVYDSGDDLPF